MKSSEYWQSRAEQNILNSEANAAEIATKVETVYNQSMKQIENEINRFYARYATQQKITLEEAQKRLNPAELKSFRKQAAEYYSEAKKNNWRKSYTEEMRALSAKAYMSRLEELKANIYHQIQKTYEYELKETETGLVKQYNESFLRTMYDYQTGLEVGASFPQPNIKAVDIAIKQKWYGENYSSNVWNDRDKLVQSLQYEIPRMFTLGENPNQAARHLAQIIDPKFKSRTKDGRELKSKCARVLQTEFNQIANQASRESIQEFDDSLGGGLFETYTILSTLDNKTCDDCGDIEEKSNEEPYKLSDAEAGVNFPPFHPSCRCSYIIVIDDQKIKTRIARDKSGKSYYVDGSLTYKEWFKTVKETEAKAEKQPEKEKATKYKSSEPREAKFATFEEGQNEKMGKIPPR